MMARRASSRRTGIRAHHAEWLSLLDISGPFISLPVLERTFPQGLDAEDTDLVARVRIAHEEWLDSLGRADRGELHGEWVRFVLREVLRLPSDSWLEGEDVPEGCLVRVREHGETLRPDIVILDPHAEESRAPRVLIMVLPPGQDPEKPLPGHHWKASPTTRMIELLGGAGPRGVRLGLLTNGEQWTLIHAPRGETVGYASWYASLWLDERVTLRAFQSLLGAYRLFGVPDEETLEALYVQSARDQEEITDQLGLQVRTAVEILVQAIDRIDRDRGRRLLEGFDERVLYEAAMTTMMRLVFVLYAEERGLLPLGEPFYDANYAIHTLQGRLQEDADRHGEEVLERRHAAWCRLLATFRAIHGGVEHEALRLPPYGGVLFDPDRFPFLEGRARGTTWRETTADPLPIDDRTVLHLLNALQYLALGGPGGGAREARRLSFRALGVEQIGHVYESLLDHTAVRASGPVLGLVGPSGEEPEVPLSDLEEWRTNGRQHLVERLVEVTGKQARTIERALEKGIEDDGRWLVSCDNDRTLLERIRPYAGLVRGGTNGCPVIVGAGSVYVTKGTDRRSTGTHYTPPTLTEPIVKHALDPLVYVGPAEGKSEDQWQLRSPGDILALKVCDMACGSGAFLVQACRYLAERLVEAWEELEAANPGRAIVTPEGDLSNGAASERPLPKDTDERLTIARRIVADRCLYGVDKNPMAVEMAKLSLWLVTMERNRPFEFLDHAIKSGDALLGVSSIEQLLAFHPDPTRGRSLFQNRDLFHDVRTVTERAVEEASRLRRELQAIAVIDIRDAEAKDRLNERAERALQAARVLGDLVTGTALASRGRAADLDDRLRGLAPLVTEALAGPAIDGEWKELGSLVGAARAMLDEGKPPEKPSRSCFHWPLEFAEVFDRDRPGFDAFVGNPPFQGGQRITGEHGTDYRDYLVHYVAGGKRGSADLCAYFFLRAGSLLRDGGGFGLLATNTIAQGDTREIGLESLVDHGAHIYKAEPSLPWPGLANVDVAAVWIRNGAWNGRCMLKGKATEQISVFLTQPGRVSGTPFRLKKNAGRSFIGSIVLGMGFVLTPEEAQALIAREPRNRDVLFPYLNGEDLNGRPDQSPSRWVINFFDWPLTRDTDGSWARADEKRRKAWLRDGRVPPDYPDPVAADYPECLRIVEEKVKPEREKSKRKVRRERWWQFAERATALYTTIESLESVTVCALVSKNLIFDITESSKVFANKLCVVADDDPGTCGALQSEFHVLWAWRYSSTMRNAGINYSPSDCFETWPRPPITDDLREAARNLLEERRILTTELGIGLNRLYSMINDPNETSNRIGNIRQLHSELDQTAAKAYGWDDLLIDHGFHPASQGIRYTLPEDLRDEILDRLLALNHERYGEEVEQGLHDEARSRRRKGASRSNPMAKRTAADVHPRLDLG